MVRFEKTQLSNGVRVVTENHSDSKAIAIGIWVITGTRDEPESNIGISHFLEHLVFKGTKTKSAYEIARSFEAVGGDLNAYTTREYTVFHGLVLKEDWEMALSILADLVTEAQFAPKDIELERSVVMQEIAMSPDNLEEYVFDVYFEDAYKGHSMGRPILGTEESLKNTGEAAIRKYYDSYYTGPRIIVSAAGNLDHKAFSEKVDELLGKKSSKAPAFSRTVPQHKSFRRVMDRPSEQCHLLIGMESTGFKDDMRFDAYITNALLGGGMISKLYQSVREKKGLVYSIYSALTSSTDSGVLTIYAGTEKKHVAEVLETIGKDLRDIKNKGISQDDIDLFKHQVRGSIILGSDDVENRMTSLGVNEMVFGVYRPVEDVISEVGAVTRESLTAYLDKYLSTDQFGVLMIGEGLVGQAAEKMIKDWEI